MIKNELKKSDGSLEMFSPEDIREIDERVEYGWLDVLSNPTDRQHDILKTAEIRFLSTVGDEFGLIDPRVKAEVLISQVCYPEEAEQIDADGYVWSEDDVTRLYGEYMDYVYFLASVGNDERTVLESGDEFLEYGRQYLQWLQSMNDQMWSIYAWNDDKLLEHLKMGLLFAGSGEALEKLKTHPNPEVRDAASQGNDISIETVLCNKKEIIPNFYYNKPKSLDDDQIKFDNRLVSY